MIDLNNENFEKVKDQKLVEKITSFGPFYFYYENRGPPEIMGVVPKKEIPDYAYTIKFGFHTGLESNLKPKFDSRNFFHGSPRIELEMVVSNAEKFNLQYLKGAALVSPEFDSTTHEFWQVLTPDKYFLYEPNERNEFEGYVVGRLTELGLINQKIREIHSKRELDKDTTIKKGIGYFHNLLEKYIEDRFIDIKEMRIN